MNIQTSPPEPDSTGQLERLLQFAAEYTPEQPAPDDLMARAMARWRQRQASSREGRRTAALLSGIGLALLVAAIGLSVAPRRRGTMSGRSAPRVVGRVRRDLTAMAPHPESAPLVRRPGREEGMALERPSNKSIVFGAVRTPARSPRLPRPPLSQGGDQSSPTVSGTGTAHPDAFDSAHRGVALDDLNDDPLTAVQHWATLPPDERDRTEAQVRRDIRGRDDFVTIPFPRIASTSDRPLAQASESYQRKAAIVDPRLSREVTCAFKATALSDLCDQLRAETGIPLSAGPSVADEKVTLFCGKMPLRDVMRQLSHPFGYTWLRSRQASGVGRQASGDGRTDPNAQRPTPADAQRPTPNASFRYELVQDLRSQLLEEELRNRDRNAALLALEEEIERYRPYLHLLPDEALARAQNAPPEEKKLLETLSGKGWAVIQMYTRLSAQDQAALRAGHQVRFATDPGPGDQPLPPEIQKGVLQAFRDWKVVRDGERYKMAWEPDTPGAVSAETLSLSLTDASVGLQLGQSELGRLGLHGDVYWGIPGNRVGGGGSDESFVEAVSPAVAKPDNRAANARLARDPSFRLPITVVPVAGSTRFAGARSPDVSPAKMAQAGHDGAAPTGAWRPGIGEAGQPGGSEKVTTADVLETLHRASGMPIVADYYTRLYKPETVSARGQSLFEALNELCETMRFRWNRDEGTGALPAHPVPGYPSKGGEGGSRSWLQFRSASYYDDRLKEVPNRLLSRWVAARQKHGALTLDDLCEIAQLSDAQLNAREMGEGARELFGLKEWDLGSNVNLRGSLRLLAGFTPAQRQEATTTAGLAFSRMSLAQQQRYIALALETSGQPLQSPEELTGATLRVEYTQPGGFQWGDPRHPGRGYYTRWVVPLELTPRGRRVPRPSIHERTREAALQAVRRVDPQLRQALLQAARRANPRLDDSPRVAEDDQIFPTQLDLAIIYIPGATNGRTLHVRCTNANYNPGLE